nr:site-specific DNA-methyltransferase [Candidatus Sigynarchaeota archaeon]
MITWDDKDRPASAVPECSPVQFLVKSGDPGKPAQHLLLHGRDIQAILRGLVASQAPAPQKYQVIMLDLPIWKDPAIDEMPRPNQPYPATRDKPPGWLGGSRSAIFASGNVDAYFSALNGVLSSLRDLVDDYGFLIVKYCGRYRHYVKILMDNIMAPSSFVNEVYISSPFYQAVPGSTGDRNNAANAPKKTYLAKEVFSVLLVYSRNPKPRIIPSYKDKKSGGYWHTFFSKGQGPERVFRLGGIEHVIVPPVGSHWKFKQETIDAMCKTPHPTEPGTFMVKLNSQGQPLYWVKVGHGHIVDNNWLDIKSHAFTDLGWELQAAIYDRVIKTFSQEGDAILHVFSGSGECARIAATSSRVYAGIDPREAAIEKCRGVFISNYLPVVELAVSGKNSLEYAPPGDPPLQGNHGIKVRWEQIASKIIPAGVLRMCQTYLASDHAESHAARDPGTMMNNLLILGDNLRAMQSLLGEFKQQLQLIYIDPPYYTGTDEYMDIPTGKKDARGVKEKNRIIKDVAYPNILSPANPTHAFCQWFHERAVLMKMLLKEAGFIAVRYDYHYGHYAKAVLDEVFGQSNFLCEFLVRRINKTVSAKALEGQNHLIVQSDSLFLYRVSSKSRYFDAVVKVRRKDPDPAEIEADDDNLWIDITGYEKTKKTLYPTENSEALLDRVIKLCSRPGDIVADFFSGSGTTIARADALGRQWIGVDIGAYAINENMKRILQYKSPGSRPFHFLTIAPAKAYPPSQDKQPALDFQQEIDQESRTIRIKFKQFHVDGEARNNSVTGLDLIDFWAIDWDYNDQQCFYARDYSFRKIGAGRKIVELTSTTATHTYKRPGTYIVVLSIRDIFANEEITTFQAIFS